MSDGAVPQSAHSEPKGLYASAHGHTAAGTAERLHDERGDRQAYGSGMNSQSPSSNGANGATHDKSKEGGAHRPVTAGANKRSPDATPSPTKAASATSRQGLRRGD